MHFETVQSVTHYSDFLFSFTTSKSEEFRQFKAGQFTMIGMGDDDLLRAYSIASAPQANHLEFLSIKMPGGALTSRLQKIAVGDEIEVTNRPTGTLVLDNLTPGKRLWCLATGTGLAPFLSIVRDPLTFSRFEEVVVTHTVRTCSELAYAEMLIGLPIHYYPTVTREEFFATGRITDHIDDGSLFASLGIDRWNPQEDRVMLCGSHSFNNDLKQRLDLAGFSHGSNRQSGSYVQERAYVTTSMAAVV